MDLYIFGTLLLYAKRSIRKPNPDRNCTDTVIKSRSSSHAAANRDMDAFCYARDPYAIPKHDPFAYAVGILYLSKHSG